MDAVTIKFKANGQQLTRVGSDNFAANTVSYIRAEFELGDNWDGWDSVRAVWATDFAKVATVLDGSGACTVPWEVLNRTGTLYVNLVGSISDGDELTDRLTTYKAKALDVNGCTNVDGDNTQPITPSQFEQFAEIVHDDAEAAADARDEASGYASDAEGYRDEAVGAAADAKDYRDAAKGYADDAEGYKDQAKGYADEAEADAQEIRNMSATATTLPAGSSATASYSDGVLTLGIPKGDTGATGATGNGIASAVLNADYTLTLNFTNGTHYTTPPIRGAQGVQGETGNGIESVYLTATHGAVKTYTILFTDGTTYDFNVTDGEVTNAMLEAVLPTDTASGAIASFPDGSDLFDYLSCVVDIEPVQAGSGTPSPDNVRPITGWTGCEVDVCGVNLFDGTLEQGTFTNSGVESASNTRIRTDYVKVAQGDVTISTPTANTYIHEVYSYDKNKNFVTRLSSGISASSGTVTVPSGAEYIRFSIRYSNNANITPNDGIKVQVELGSTATTYTPYNGTTYPVSWQTEAGTVYGGTVDLVSGVLTVDRAMVTLDGTEDGWDFYAGYKQANIALPRMAKYVADSVTYLCDAFNPVPNNVRVLNIGNYASLVLSGSNVAFSSSAETLEDFKTLIGSQPVSFCYELATPTTYQLTPTQVACLLGQNNVWADCGDTSVTYKADVQRYIEKMLNS